MLFKKTETTFIKINLFTKAQETLASAHYLAPAGGTITSGKQYISIMKLILFLASGVSIDSGHPNVVALTKALLNSKNHPSETKFLKALKNYDKKARQLGGTYTSPRRYLKHGEIFRNDTSYEDLYYLCEEITLFDWGQHNNAMIPAFMESLVQDFSPWLKENSKRRKLLEIGKFANSAKKYINKTIIENLGSPKEIVGLDLIIQLAEYPKITSLEIITLNHDLLVEDFLTRKGIEFIDGFSNPDGNVRWFEPDTYLSNKKVKLIKLHGSIDWYSFAVNGVEKIGKITGDCSIEIKNSGGKNLQFLNNSPKVLSGLNKINYYNSGFYTDIHYYFQRALYQNSLMAMSGYGWGDDPINTRLMTWLDRKKENKLILLHRDPEELMKRSLIFSRDYSNWVEAGKLKPIRKWLSETDLIDIRKVIVD